MIEPLNIDEARPSDTHGRGGRVRTVCGAALGGLLVGPEAGAAVRRRVALHEELAVARGAALLQHAVLRRARAHGVARHGQARDGVVRAARRPARALRALRLTTLHFHERP